MKYLYHAISYKNTIESASGSHCVRKLKYNYKAFYQARMVSLLGQKLSIIVFLKDPIGKVQSLEERIFSDITSHGVPVHRDN